MAAVPDKSLSLLLVGLVGWEEKGGRVEKHVNSLFTHHSGTRILLPWEQ